MKIGVIGGGAWGTALAQVAAHGGREVLLWAREPEVVAAVNDGRGNPLFLADIALSPTIRATGSLGEMGWADALLVVAPAQHVGRVLAQIDVGIRPLVLCAKGIEAGTQRLMGEVARDVHPHAPVAVLSGPTFAHEVARGLPTAVTLACEDAELRGTLAERLAAPHFRPYASGDVIGAEIGGALYKDLACKACPGYAAGVAEMIGPSRCGVILNEAHCDRCEGRCEVGRRRRAAMLIVDDTQAWVGRTYTEHRFDEVVTMCTDHPSGAHDCVTCTRGTNGKLAA